MGTVITFRHVEEPSPVLEEDTYDVTIISCNLIEVPEDKIKFDQTHYIEAKLIIHNPVVDGKLVDDCKYIYRLPANLTDHENNRLNNLLKVVGINLIENGAKFELEDLIGKKFRAIIKDKIYQSKGDGKTRTISIIDSVLPTKKTVIDAKTSKTATKVNVKETPKQKEELSTVVDDELEDVLTNL